MRAADTPSRSFTSPALREGPADLPLTRKAGGGMLSSTDIDASSNARRLSARIPDSEVLPPTLGRDRALDAKSSK